eukprot:UN25001
MSLLQLFYISTKTIIICYFEEYKQKSTLKLRNLSRVGVNFRFMDLPVKKTIAFYLYFFLKIHFKKILQTFRKVILLYSDRL